VHVAHGHLAIQAIERERESNSIHESRLRKDIDELQQNHSSAELNRRSAKSVAIGTRKRYGQSSYHRLRSEKLT
jgi:hypothetical protein